MSFCLPEGSRPTDKGTPLALSRPRVHSAVYSILFIEEKPQKNVCTILEKGPLVLYSDLERICGLGQLF